LQTIDIQPRTRATYRYLYYAICMALMYGLYEFVYLMITGISRQFGFGFFAGSLFALAMFYLGSRAEDAEKEGR
jgi:cyanate permease